MERSYGRGSGHDGLCRSEWVERRGEERSGAERNVTGGGGARVPLIQGVATGRGKQPWLTRTGGGRGGGRKGGVSLGLAGEVSLAVAWTGRGAP